MEINKVWQENDAIVYEIFLCCLKRWVFLFLAIYNRANKYNQIVIKN